MSLRRYRKVLDDEAVYQTELNAIRSTAEQMIREHRTETLQDLRVRGDAVVQKLQKLRDERLILERRLATAFVNARPQP